MHCILKKIANVHFSLKSIPESQNNSYLNVEIRVTLDMVLAMRCVSFANRIMMIRIYYNKPSPSYVCSDDVLNRIQNY
jgi:hypothetical protein